MWLVFKKELLELLRDRKTLFFMIALPLLLFPLIFGAFGFFASKAVKEAETKVLKYAIVGGEYAKGLSDSLAAASDKFELVEVGADADFTQLIRDETIDFALKVPSNYDQPLLEGGQATLVLVLNDAGLNMVQSRVKELVDSQVEDKRRQAFDALALNDFQQTGLLKPVVIEKEDVADSRENWGEKIGGFLPYILFLLCLQGAMYPATDMGAGEKERGTLETLLISPTERHKLVLGKFLTIAFAGVTCALMTILSMAVWGVVLSQGMAIKVVGEFMSAISVLDFVLMFLMLAPIAAIFAALLLSLSIYARSFKEAQSYMGSLIMVAILPIVMAMMPGVDLKGGWAWVPITNVALAIKELIKGTMDYVSLFAIFGSTVMIAGALIAFCVYWFNQEKVLFR